MNCILISFENLSLRQRNPLSALPDHLCFTGAYDGRGFSTVPRYPISERWQATSSIFIIIYSSQPVFCNGNSFESTPLCRAIREPYWPSVSREALRRAPFGKMKETVLNANIHRAWRSEKGLLPYFGFVCYYVSLPLCSKK